MKARTGIRLATASCNTGEGAGQDMTSAGQAIARATDQVQSN